VAGPPIATAQFPDAVPCPPCAQPNTPNELVKKMTVQIELGETDKNFIAESSLETVENKSTSFCNSEKDTSKPQKNRILRF
jgi:hypothetical protein